MPATPMSLITRARCPRYGDRKSTRLNSSHEWTSYAVFCLKKKSPRRHNAGKLGIEGGDRERHLDEIAPHQRRFGHAAARMAAALEHFADAPLFFFYWYGDHRDLHSFPTRRSSDLQATGAGRRSLILGGWLAALGSLPHRP